MIPSAELHPQGGRIHQSHLLCLNIPAEMSLETIHGGRNQDGSGMQAVIDAVNAAGGACFAAHPNWCGLRSEEVARLHSLAGMEIYNHDCQQGINRGYSDEFFNELCDRGIRLPVIAVDDSHSPDDYFGGITYICCRELTIPSVMEAIRKGAVFASQGPRFTSLSFKDGIFEAHFTPAKKAVLMTNRCRGFYVGGPRNRALPQLTTVSSLRFDANQWRYEPECTDVKQHIRWQFQCNYLQCVVDDEMGRKAWSSPIYLPALNEKL